MAEFLANYGIWIVFGLLFLVMMWGHSRGHGMGCGMGGHQHGSEEKPDESKAGEQPQSGKLGSGCH